MANKPNIEHAFKWSSKLLEERILQSLDYAIKEKENAQKAAKQGKKLPKRFIRKDVTNYLQRVKSLKSQIKELRRGLGGVILTNPEHYKKTGLFRMIAENIGEPEIWTDDLSEGLVKGIKKYGGAMTYTAQVNQFNPAGKVGHHRTALSTLRDAIAPLSGDVRAEFKRLALADGYKVGEEFIDYLDPGAHKKFTKHISGALADRLKYTHVDQIQPNHLKLIEAMAERSAHAAAFGGEGGFFLPKELIKEGASADEVYRHARPYVELSIRGAEAGLELDEILTSNRWNTAEDLLEIIEKEMPIQDTTPVLNRMRVDLMDAGLLDAQGNRGPELEKAVKQMEYGGIGGTSLVKDSGRSGISPDEMRKNSWYSGAEVEASANKALARSIKGWNPGGLIKASTGLNRAESVLQMAGGNYAGGAIGLAMTTPTFQKKIGGLLLKQGIRALPGVSFGSGALQAAGYMMGGQWTKAGIAALGGVIGEIPGYGDVVQSAMEVGLTAHDIKAGKLKTDIPDEIETVGDPLRKVGRTFGKLAP